MTNGYINRGVFERMPSRQEIRSEETKQAILASAGRLFTERGFDAVTMREIAKAAGCSHTTIYIYFKDKEALLHHLAMGPLQSLHQQLGSVLIDPTATPHDRFRAVSRTFIRFCLQHRTIYTTLFMARGSRVDEAEPALEVQQMRNQLFGQLREAVQQALPPGQTDEQVLAYARIHFFTLHGLISTYAASEEPLDALLERLAPTFDLAVEVMLAGCNHIATTGGRPQ